jgi:hypothetical protein
MARTRKPLLGRYVLEFKRVIVRAGTILVKSCRYNGTTQKYRRWREARMRTARDSRRINRAAA